MILLLLLLLLFNGLVVRITLWIKAFICPFRYRTDEQDAK